MMFMKWLQYTAKTDFQPHSPGCAPSVLIMFINMMLFKDSEPLHGCDEYMFVAQPTVQRTFVFIALICIPWMLLGKPFYIMFSRKNKAAAAHQNGGINQQIESTTELADSSAAGHGHDDEPLSEIFIHQAIHTIEYTLSTVSHTASYLRLWALSLAHARKYYNVDYFLYICL